MASRAPERQETASEPTPPAIQPSDSPVEVRDDVSAGPAAGRGASRPARAVVITVLVGLVLTGVSAWAAYRADMSTEDRLLETQTRQAATVLSTAILVIEQPLTTALQVQATAGPDGDPSVFRRAFAANVGDDALFVSASLWRRDGRTLTRLAALGRPPGMDPRGPEVQDFLSRALKAETSVVERVSAGRQDRIAYALADPGTGFVVKVERALPTDRRAPVDRDSAYANIDYAIYFGEGTRLVDMTTTNVDPADLPLDGRTAAEEIPFGDTVLTLVTRPDEHLGSSLSHRLWLILLAGGLLLTIATAFVVRQRVGIRSRVETDSATINALYQKINGLYEEQRAVFVRLQRALLPQVMPPIPQIEIASKYVAGTEGIEIGGDWYSVIDIGEDHFGFVVGDVSGRGVDAVAEMARARFTLRAYLVDGNTPDEALEKCSRQFDVTVDDHITTAVVGLGAWRTGEVVVASAGHPLPLLISTDRSEQVAIPVGPPLGVGASSYRSTTFTMPPGSTLVAYTDGLVERRGEDIDTGIRRLVDAARRHGHEPVDDLLTSLLTALRGAGAADDIAMLALRRLPPR
ncbi:PP2C family protein-serine/threonine phosphatase [Nocardioides bizhenqiangii]|uniref:PP2C family protein-serine/threonine phosphatase n=1 Tax=Nocardioides bizhenqiangii TaxID=3095076 RepID=A0ABZ0ZPE0_9ACTN|nr:MULTISPECIES: PP2C family protein-serine/threonine phosphatase [unclassified Nocardioides]MDZ5620063.1 PP2C family protein-serine/threonine phosphatase [Nocardioides sp. HM23]WQQ25935.1 PP2C family protein-serine/threonine phosphatase [Nocardioides sp. HM61]